MKIFSFLLLAYAHALLVTNKTVEIYLDTLGEVYLNYEQGFVNRVTNSQHFSLTQGYAKVTFDINNHDVKLLQYLPQKQQTTKELRGTFSPMFNKQIHIGVFRGANRRDPSKCTPIEKAKDYVRYAELSMRLWSANQVSVKTVYISSQCLVIDEAIYVEGNYGTINNALSAAASEIDEYPTMAVRWYITDDYPGSWSGLAAGGSPYVVTNPTSNYWLICKYNPGEEDPNNAKVSTLTHEFGHSCGLGHGGTNDQSATGTFTNFFEVDNYADCGNIMGNCAGWDHPINAAQYWHLIVGQKGEPWLFKYPEEGVHKYRLYSFDHPFSRYFLGSDIAFHTDDEIFDGIGYKYNCLGIRILVDKSMTSKYAGADGTSGSIMLEYRHNAVGLKGSREYGVRVTNGFGSRGVLLMANLDHLKSWADSEITLGVDYYPADFDTGTLRIRVTKIHKAALKESLENEIAKEQRRNYDEAAYAELEIEYYPNKKPIIPTSPQGDDEMPELILSPSFHNCQKKSDKSGYECSLSSTKSGWYYVVNNNNDNNNLPRIYQNGNDFMKGRKALRSYNGWEFTNSFMCSGVGGSKCINVIVSLVNYPGVTRYIFINANITRHKQNIPNPPTEYYGIKTIIFGYNLIVPEGARVYLSDLFGNEINIKVVGNSFAEFIDPLETDGIGEGEVIMKDKDGKVIYYSGFTIYNPENGNRVAVEYREDGKFELSPAAMPNNNYYTTTTMIYSARIKANDWYCYPILNLEENDYVLIDFKNIIPNDLIITIETEMGEYIRDLSELGGLNNISYKLTCKELSKATGGWCEIDRIKFNKDVDILNIRPIYRNQVGNQMAVTNGGDNKFNFDGYRYIFKFPYIGKDYVYKKVNLKIDGKIYSFPTSTSKIVLDHLIEPTTAIPTTSPPTTQSPTTIKPTTEKPTTEKPTTEKPTTEKPTTQIPTTQIPTTEKPTTLTPTTEKPTTEKPTTLVPTTEKPTTQSPTTEKPTTEKPTTLEPTTDKPTTVSPSTDSPTQPPTINPTTYSPTTSLPTSSFPTTDSPTSSSSPTLNPSSDSSDSSDYDSDPTDVENSDSEDSKEKKIIFFGIVIGGGVVVILLILLCCCVCCRMKISKKATSTKGKPKKPKNVEPQKQMKYNV